MATKIVGFPKTISKRELDQKPDFQKYHLAEKTPGAKIMEPEEFTEIINTDENVLDYLFDYIWYTINMNNVF